MYYMLNNVTFSYVAIHNLKIVSLFVTVAIIYVTGFVKYIPKFLWHALNF